ncbi:hypothetical protein CIB84_005246 [Bambusicola thoracicus]|uniref:Uncharacterized protein n=1 Tax=Bambusicola thoracicus TaxID=9083 RepID=A0A2P4T3T2_BAMTH|nr:hypothetical protein CIB84_005246 [Bambusicola thoracicus]
MLPHWNFFMGLLHTHFPKDEVTYLTNQKQSCSNRLSALFIGMHLGNLKTMLIKTYCSVINTVTLEDVSARMEETIISLIASRLIILIYFTMQGNTANGKSILWIPQKRWMGQLVCWKNHLQSSLGSHLDLNATVFSSV